MKKYISAYDGFDDAARKFYLDMVNNVADYEYDHEWVNAPSAMGDAHKSSCSYTIMGYDFKYHHISGDGGILSAKFTMSFKKKEIILTYSQFTELAARFRRGTKKETPKENKLLAKFMSAYDSDIESKHYHIIFGILNAFAFGWCAMIMDDKVEVVGFDFETKKDTEESE